MADPYNTQTHIRETRTTNTTGGGSMALIVGGLVVAVAFILWLVFAGGDRPVVATDPANDTTNVSVEPAAPADSTTNVTIEGDEPAADPVVPVEPAPADAVETAPAETGAAPAGGTEAPANP